MCSSRASRRNAPESRLIKGVRLAMFTESSDNDKLNDAFIKAATGEDEISLRGLYGNQFTMHLTDHIDELFSWMVAGARKWFAGAVIFWSVYFAKCIYE